MFPHLFEPSGYEGAEKKTYNCMLVFGKDVDLTPLAQAVRACGQSKWPNGAAGVRNPLRDGNEKADQWGEVFKDAHFIRIATEFKPTVLDRKKQVIADPEKVYSGCYARAVVSPFAYDTKGNKGVTLGMDGVVQITRDGEKLTSAAAAVGKLDDLPVLSDPSVGQPNPDSLFGDTI